MVIFLGHVKPFRDCMGMTLSELHPFSGIISLSSLRTPLFSFTSLEAKSIFLTRFHLR